MANDTHDLIQGELGLCDMNDDCHESASVMDRASYWSLSIRVLHVGFIFNRCFLSAY